MNILRQLKRLHKKSQANKKKVQWDSSETVRVVFLAQYSPVWSSWRSVWQVMSQDRRFSVRVLAVPFIHEFTDKDATIKILQTDLKYEGVPFSIAKPEELKKFNPHVVFVQNPYDQTRPDYLQVARLKNAGYRIAYVPYGLEIGGGKWNLNAQFDLPLQKEAWRIFARSERHRKLFGLHCSKGDDHVIVTGHPRFDTKGVNLQRQPLPNNLQAKIDGRRVILWTPHFSVGDKPAWSTFQIYGQKILQAAKDRPDIFLLIRPHPLFFKAMRKANLWDEYSEARFRGDIENATNMALDNSSDYWAAFAASDGLMADVGSFLLEYLTTGKPLMYLRHPDGMGMNDDGELAEYLYVANSAEDIQQFISMVAACKDSRGDERRAVIPEFIWGLEGCAARRIADNILLGLTCDAEI